MKIRVEIPKGRGNKFKVALSTLKSADLYQINTTKKGTMYCAEYDTVKNELFIVFAFCSMLDTARFFIDGKASSPEEVYDLIKKELFKEGGAMYHIDALIDFKKGITSCFVGPQRTGDELLKEIKEQIKNQGKPLK